MYRFRTVQNLIGEFQELEKQQIYFAHPEQLNDPMEGMRRYYWQGDEIIWRNLMKHYILCMEHVIFMTRLRVDDENLKIEDIPIFKCLDHLPTEIYKNRIKEIYDIFFSNSFVQEYLKFIIDNPYKIFIEEMYVHLKVLSTFVLDAIFEMDVKNGFIEPSENFKGRINKFKAGNLSSFWESMLQDSENEKNYKILLTVVKEFFDQQEFQQVLKYSDSIRMQNIYVEFPKIYLEAIKLLTYPEAFVACFMDNCTNSSIWGTYGDNHRGVCLKFRIKDENNPTLRLKTITGHSSVSGKIYSEVDHPYKKKLYTTEFDEIDFFRNIGRLPIPQLNKQWYTNEFGEYSDCGKHLITDIEAWRKSYWDSFESAYFKKLPEWKHEREYRIIISSGLESFKEPKDRLLEYNFEDLEAIIFGMKTPKEERIKIIDIITDKCQKEGRGEFDFYEMTYSNAEKEMIPKKIYSVKI